MTLLPCFSVFNDVHHTYNGHNVDRCYDETATQENVFEQIKPLCVPSLNITRSMLMGAESHRSSRAR